MKNKENWVDAKRQYRLTDKHIQMDRELGMNPKKLGKIANHKQEPWKAPIHEFIESLYFKNFKKTSPDNIHKI